MASFWSRNVTYRSVELCVLGLDGVVADYDKFVYTIEQNNITVMEYTVYPKDIEDSNVVSGIYVEFDNPDYLGYNVLSPGCDYTAYLDCYKNGELYSISDPVDFTTDEISPPSVSQITPDVYVAVRDQGDYETCVADSLACAMDIFKMRETGIKYENFSTAYIYGTDGDDKEGMYNDEAVDNCYEHGSPRWEISSGFFSDSMWENEAAELFSNAEKDITIYNHAKNQKFEQKASSCNVDFYDCDGVADAIETNGYFMFNFRIPNNFYGISEGGEVGSDGIIPQPDEYSGVNHSMALIGLTTINGKKHWIAQNSWGENWGYNGRCYLPYDWGCGVQSPLYKTYSGEESPEFGEPSSWTTDCYAPSPGSGYTDNNPDAVYNISAKLVEDSARGVYIEWDSDTPDYKYFVLARQTGTEQWYIKTTTTDTFATIYTDKYGRYEFMIISNNISYYCSPQSKIVEIDVEDSAAPEPWEWESSMSGDLDVKMCSCKNEYFYYEYPMVCPVTATEWSNFLSRINEVLKYNGYDAINWYFSDVFNSTVSELIEYGGYDGYVSGVMDFDPIFYNEAAEAIRSLWYLDEYELPDITADTELSAALFIALRDKLNMYI